MVESLKKVLFKHRDYYVAFARDSIFTPSLFFLFHQHLKILPNAQSRVLMSEVTSCVLFTGKNQGMSLACRAQLKQCKNET